MDPKRPPSKIAEIQTRHRSNLRAFDRLHIATQMDSYFFKDAPLPIWVEDLSRVKLHLDSLEKKGIRDLKTHFERHPEEVVSLAREVKVVDVNEATLRLFQAEDREEFFKGLSQVFNKESYVTFKEEMIALAEGKKEFRSEAVNLTMKGEEIHSLMELVIPAGYENTWSCVCVYITDLTDLKEREAQLRESEEKYRRVFESAGHALFMADIETGIIIDANEETGMLLGISSGKVVGMHFTELYPRENANWYKEVFRKHIGRERVFSNHLVICDKRGRRIPVSLGSSIVEIGGKSYFIGIFQELGRKDSVPGPEQTAAMATVGWLTGREVEIVRLIAKGSTSREIAKKLSISEKTVETHRTRMMKKLDFHRTADLVRYAMTLKLIE